MTIHKEGKGILITIVIVVIIINSIVYLTINDTLQTTARTCYIISGCIFLFLLNFFRTPNRPFVWYDDGMIVAPADGSIVLIYPTEEYE